MGYYDDDDAYAIEKEVIRQWSGEYYVDDDPYMGAYEGDPEAIWNID